MVEYLSMLLSVTKSWFLCTWIGRRFFSPLQCALPSCPSAPAQQTCATLPSHSGTWCSDPPADRPELACTAGTWLANASRLYLRSGSLAALQSSYWTWSSHLLGNFCSSSWTLQQFLSPWVICLVPGREIQLKSPGNLLCAQQHTDATELNPVSSVAIYKRL